MRKPMRPSLRLAPVLIAALAAFALGACSKSGETAEAEHAAPKPVAITAEDLNRQAAEDAAAAATAPADSFPAPANGAPPPLPAADDPPPAAAPAPAPEAAAPPAGHH